MIHSQWDSVVNYAGLLLSSVKMLHEMSAGIMKEAILKASKQADASLASHMQVESDRQSTSHASLPNVQRDDESTSAALDMEADSPHTYDWDESDSIDDTPGTHTKQTGCWV
eukprot:1067336-Rhodomonas_salina.1